MKEQSRPDGADAAAVARHARGELGAPGDWNTPPGHPESLALCVLDALWSQSSVDSTAAVLAFYRETREEDWGEPDTDGAVELAGAIEAVGGPGVFAERLRKQLPGASTRVAVMNVNAVIEACEVLVAADLTSAAQLRAASAEALADVERPWKRMAGQRSGASFRRLLLLAGCPTVPGDRRTQGFAAAALGREVTLEESTALVAAAAAELGVPPAALDDRIRHAGT